MTESGKGGAAAGTDERAGSYVGGYRQAQGAVADPERLAAVRATGLLDTHEEAVFDRLTRLAVRLVGVPAAFLSLVDEHRDFYKSACGFGDPLTSTRELAGPTFCHYAIQSAVPLVIPDTAADPAYRDVPTVRSLGVAAYVGIPLVVHGQPVGSFCAIDTRPRAWTPDDLEVLTELAAAAQREVELRVTIRAAESTNQQLQEQAAELEAQSEELHAAAVQLEEQAEAADVLRRVAEGSTARVTGVLEAMSDAYFALDADFRIAAVNLAMERNVGQPRTALLGRSMWEAFPGTVGNVFERSYRAAATEGASVHFTHDYSDGRLELVTEVDVYPAEGGGLAVFWRDVTARMRSEAALRESEERFRLMADAVPQIVWITDPGGRVEFFNAQWTAYTGAAFEPTTAAAVAASFVHPEDGAATVAAFDEARRTGGVFSIEHRIRSGDGIYRWFLVRAQPFRDTRTGEIVRWFGVSVDIDDRKRVEAERARLLAAEREARAEAETANRAKGEFLAVMSHELRTPLNAIGGYAELIELGIRGPVTPQQRDDLARIQKSQRHLLGLINGVLNYSRAEAGAVHYDLDDVPLDAVLATCETLIAPQARAKRIALKVVGCSASLTARADREKLQQIVVNLLSNAVKFTAAGGSVTVTCARHADGGGEARVVVKVGDTGRGIAADALEHVFEPFVQVDTRLTRTEEGMGLGLAISRDLARGMRGDLTAESTLGVGSTFTLALPTV